MSDLDESQMGSADPFPVATSSGLSSPDPIYGSDDSMKMPLEAAAHSIFEEEAPSNVLGRVIAAKQAADVPSPTMPAEDANKLAGEHLWDAPVSEYLVNYTIEQRKQSAQRKEVIEQFDQDHSWYTNLAVHNLAFVLDPVGAVTMMFGPGEEALAVKMGGSLAARVAARGVVGGGMGGVIGAGTAGLKLAESNVGITDYDLKDALTDVAQMAGTAGAIHIGVGALFGPGSELRDKAMAAKRGDSADPVVDGAAPAGPSVPGETIPAGPAGTGETLPTSVLSDAAPVSASDSLAIIKQNINAMTGDSPYSVGVGMRDLAVMQSTGDELGALIRKQDALNAESAMKESAELARGEMVDGLSAKIATLRDSLAPIKNDHARLVTQLADEESALTEHLAAVGTRIEVEDVSARLAAARAERETEVEIAANHLFEKAGEGTISDEPTSVVAPARPAEPPAPAEPPIPPLPDNLLQVLAANGGLRDDEGHDLAGMGANKIVTRQVASKDGSRLVPVNKKLISARGMGVDDAGELLWQNHFFGDYNGTQRPSVDDVLEKIRHALAQDSAGKPVYSDADHGHVQAHEDALAQRAANSESKKIRGQIIEHEKSGGLKLSEDERQSAAAYLRKGHSMADAVELAMEEHAIYGAVDNAANIRAHEGAEHDGIPFDTGTEGVTYRDSAIAGNESGSIDGRTAGERAEDGGQSGEGRSGLDGRPAVIGSGPRTGRIVNLELEIGDLERRLAELSSRPQAALDELEIGRRQSMLQGGRADANRLQARINRLERQIAKAEGRDAVARSGLNTPLETRSASVQAKQAVLDTYASTTLRRIAGAMQRDLPASEALELGQALLRGTLSEHEVIEYIQSLAHDARGAVNAISQAKAETLWRISEIANGFHDAVAPLKRQIGDDSIAAIKDAAPGAKDVELPPLPKKPVAPAEAPTLRLGEAVKESPELVAAKQDIANLEAQIGIKATDAGNIEGGDREAKIGTEDNPNLTDADRKELNETMTLMDRAQKLSEGFKAVAACLLKGGA